MNTAKSYTIATCTHCPGLFVPNELSRTHCPTCYWEERARLRLAEEEQRKARDAEWCFQSAPSWQGLSAPERNAMDRIYALPSDLFALFKEILPGLHDVETSRKNLEWSHGRMKHKKTALYSRLGVENVKQLREKFKHLVGFLEG